MKLKDYINQKMADPAFAKAYTELEPEFQIAQQVIALRLQRGLTQAQLARRVGTKPSSISRLESAVAPLSLLLLQKVAEALDTQCGDSFAPHQIPTVKI
jgi:DNA-binding XRE family transcriptional regulator